MPFCNSNLALPGHLGIILALPRSQSVPPALATKRVVEMLGAQYEKADLPAIVRENFSHLQASNREKLLSVLHKFESLFDGTLGDWNLPPVSFELKEGMKPYHGRPYPIPHKHKAVLMKDIKWLWDIGVLVWQPSLQWALQTLSYPKRIAQCVLFKILGSSISA